MTTLDDGSQMCDGEDNDGIPCVKVVANHKWGKIIAQKDGWFFSKKTDGAWCPKHIPDWVPVWKEKRGIK